MTVAVGLSEDSFRKQMLRDKEKAKVSPGATRTSAAPTRNGGPPTPTRQPTPKTRTAEEERKPVMQRKEATPKPKVNEEKKVASPAKLAFLPMPRATGLKLTGFKCMLTASGVAAKPRTSPKSSTASISSPSHPAKTSSAMKIIEINKCLVRRVYSFCNGNQHTYDMDACVFVH
ncbi:hypothetical protein J437_LFUL014205 [Ladona fulva]|uniref:Uncharacterized protein n=1 Tax=Ladona fulva TaxID=123851 RepID=A0A8K0KI21_LADFU|nr:hypothetical protein J437_LFUL014205 [Ladona fulva]